MQMWPQTSFIPARIAVRLCRCLLHIIAPSCRHQSARASTASCRRSLGFLRLRSSTARFAYAWGLSQLRCAHCSAACNSCLWKDQARLQDCKGGCGPSLLRLDACTAEHGQTMHKQDSVSDAGRMSKQMQRTCRKYCPPAALPNPAAALGAVVQNDDTEQRVPQAQLAQPTAVARLQDTRSGWA